MKTKKTSRNRYRLARRAGVRDRVRARVRAGARAGARVGQSFRSDSYHFGFYFFDLSKDGSERRQRRRRWAWRSYISYIVCRRNQTSCSHFILRLGAPEVTPHRAVLEELHHLTFALTTVHRRAATANRRNILGTEREHSKSTMVLQVLQPVRLHCKFGYSLFFSHIPQPSSDAHGTNPNRQHAHSVTRLSIDSFPM